MDKIHPIVREIIDLLESTRTEENNPKAVSRAMTLANRLVDDNRLTWEKLLNQVTIIEIQKVVEKQIRWSPLDEARSVKVKFGKYKDLSLGEIESRDHQYLKWLSEKDLKDPSLRHAVDKLVNFLF